ncbi:hypothetical protein KL86DPRO_20290 [uncultured delta proteobacterium]|uniref:Uncharacterized protein n=1 Tax=uncultured delta proteobacterium TaxID=34034 RepID=A0A212JXW9_9DELT|nr:hypothetical protein KL86DPRO_20290 [uncultured delta proteobacterium]
MRLEVLRAKEKDLRQKKRNPLIFMVGGEGLEPVTLGLQGKGSTPGGQSFTAAAAVVGDLFQDVSARLLHHSGTVAEHAAGLRSVGCRE